MKIFNSEEYKARGYITGSILRYEGYDHDVFHSIKWESETNREVKFCYDYGLMLLDSEKDIYKIIKL